MSFHKNYLLAAM